MRYEGATHSYTHRGIYVYVATYTLIFFFFSPQFFVFAKIFFKKNLFFIFDRDAMRGLQISGSQS